MEDKWNGIYIRGDMIVSMVAVITILAMGTASIAFMVNILERVGIANILANPVTISITAAALLLFAVAIVVRAEIGGRPVDLARRRKAISLWNRLLSPGITGFVFTGAMTAVFAFVARGLPSWTYYSLILLFIMNWVREFSTNYYLHREAFDKLTFQTLTTLHSRVRQIVGLLAGDVASTVRCAIIIRDPDDVLVPLLTYNWRQKEIKSRSFLPGEGPIGNAWLYRRPFYQALSPEQSGPAWIWAFPLLNKNRRIVPIGVLAIEGSYPLPEPESYEQGAWALNELATVGIDFSLVLASQIAAGPVRSDMLRRLI